MHINSNQQAWLEHLNEELPRYLQTLKVPNQPGRFLPCSTGSTEVGKQMALGFCCFALKTYYMLELWQKLEPQQKAGWVAFLKSFQIIDYALGGKIAANAFVDPPVVKYLAGQVPRYRRLVNHIFHREDLNLVQRVIISETKQAIATLFEVGELTDRPYQGFPVTLTDVGNYLQRLDWTQPWSAGGRAAALVVFLQTEAPRFLENGQVQPVLDFCAQFYQNLADEETGAYFNGSVPSYGQLINGAMKVLTALDWLDVPVHYPKRLIDTCLKQLPESDGCHLVDAVYVLFRCMQQTQYRSAEIQAYCGQVLDMISQHHNSDGGFSYYIRQSQTNYYGVEFSHGLAESDIHGTCLLTWALVMLLEIFNENQYAWRVIKP